MTALYFLLHQKYFRSLRRNQFVCVCVVYARFVVRPPSIVCSRTVHYVFTLSVPLSVPCQHRLVLGHDGRKPARYPCGRVHSCINIGSPAGERVHSCAKWNRLHGWQVHYTDAATAASSDCRWYSALRFRIIGAL